MRQLMIASILALVVVPAALADDPAPAVEFATILQNMGYEPKDLGNGAYQIEVAAGGNTYYFSIQASGSGKYLWLNQYLAEIPPADSVATPRIFALLEANDRIQPAHFRVHSTAEKRELYLSMPLETQGLSPARLRFAIEHLSWAMNDTAALWNVAPEAWKAAAE